MGIDERFYYNRRYKCSSAEASYGALLSRQISSMALDLASAGATHLGARFRTQAHGLASLGLDVLFQVRLGPSGLCAQDTAVAPARRRPQTCRALSGATWTSLGVLSVSSRTVMNNVG